MNIFLSYFTNIMFSEVHLRNNILLLFVTKYFSTVWMHHVFLFSRWWAFILFPHSVKNNAVCDICIQLLRSICFHFSYINVEKQICLCHVKLYNALKKIPESFMMWLPHFTFQFSFLQVHIQTSLLSFCL